MTMPLQIRLAEHVTLAVPPHLGSITTYVLLEQETWFEKELSFLCRWMEPGMTVVEVGANLGVYALAMARWIGPRGHLFAYEPGSEARGLLAQSRAVNAASNLDIFDVALSDRDRAGRLLFGHSSELNTLGEAGDGEQISVTSLDSESAKRGWGSPEFLKIDAEGEEERILAGAHGMLSRHSPLIMFEIKAGTVVNQNLPVRFQELGYRLFRALTGAAILVPFDSRRPLDPFELNLFAAKPDRVRSLRDKDLLVEDIPTWAPDSAAVSHGLSLLRRCAFARAFGHVLDDARDVDPSYADALAAFAAWRTPALPAATRCAALFHAYRILADLCNRAPTTARFSTFARLAWEGGWRGESVVALRQMAAYTRRHPFTPTEPCWPANPRFDDIPADHDSALWFATGVAEQLERAQSFSSYFGGVSPWLAWLCEQPTTSREMHRRRALLEARGGINPIVPSPLRTDAPDHLNARIWRAGLVPGTRVDR
jgi:FkbM family methyltransferase